MPGAFWSWERQEGAFLSASGGECGPETPDFELLAFTTGRGSTSSVVSHPVYDALFWQPQDTKAHSVPGRVGCLLAREAQLGENFG